MNWVFVEHKNHFRKLWVLKHPYQRRPFPVPFRVQVRNFKLRKLNFKFCNGITILLIVCTSVSWKMIDLWQDLPKTLGASTHIIIKHSTQNNEDLAIFGISEPFVSLLSISINFDATILSGYYQFHPFRHLNFVCFASRLLADEVTMC